LIKAALSLFSTSFNVDPFYKGWIPPLPFHYPSTLSKTKEEGTQNQTATLQVHKLEYKVGVKIYLTVQVQIAEYI
jgi:hypothetical protein